MKLLVTGGAGYVGSICAQALLNQGHSVTVLDNLSTGNAEAIPTEADFIHGEVALEAGAALKNNKFDGVMHFAAQSLVGESEIAPAKYWDGNVLSTLALLEAMRDSDTKKLVFSSTAATYGEPASVPITESAATAPTNTYGATKLAIDHAITSYAKAYNFAAISLRYFNVAGAGLGLGENRKIETHLIPLILDTALGYRPNISIFGTDYLTPDGTAIRDYIHVLDLADAHILALEQTTASKHEIFNLGSGNGFSVREVIDAAKEITAINFSVIEAERRAGDPAILIASSAKAIAQLGWNPTRLDIHEIISDAWHYAQYLGLRAHASRK